ncbi:PhoD-like phosphatase [Palleronia marisminoris]|uniref:PhoD-like phosphatase n=1 Tax=Palleronia marisminoris TaxID=315423 RepID=A0A1Y5SWX8_9RHOB|nr:alkaline phosphatase D family protein [Palleronia marisminoris]SFH03778.1 PhoD-like phosphatase [Palleronia marisminoris]SLN49987.1 PhoD-like phosphatase [Palleronia marisminoris]
MTETAPPTGPMLFLRAAGDWGVRVAVTAMRLEGAPPPAFATDTPHEAEALATRAGATLWRAEMTLPSGGATYTCDGVEHRVSTDVTGDVTLAFASCNGQENGDLDRPSADRNALWAHLGARLDDEPVQVLLNGGDQIYADEVTKAHPLSEEWPNEVPDHLTGEQWRDLKATLDAEFFRRYATQWAQEGYAETVARIPSLCVWDDHDICDGWGSLRRKAQTSDVAKVLYAAAREAYLLFQFGCRPDERPEICIGRGRALAWRVDLPGVTLMAPDLRSTRSKSQVMSEEAWADLSPALRGTEAQTFLISSVPALGPRMSLVERAMKLTRHMEDYEDDLRDQWQSYAHRPEWRRFLTALMEVQDRPDHSLAVLSGEIHLAMRGTMRTETGALHQLVASGISHPAPPDGLATALSLLARLGEAPVKGHPIRLHPLPGKTRSYTAERNYLILRRRADRWSAAWHLEESGETAPLDL